MISAFGMGTKHLTCQQSNGPWVTNPGPPITTRGERSECSVQATQVLVQFWDGEGNTMQHMFSNS